MISADADPLEKHFQACRRGMLGPKDFALYGCRHGTCEGCRNRNRRCLDLIVSWSERSVDLLQFAEGRQYKYRYVFVVTEVKIFKIPEL
jgi:hypothetical protein